MQRSAVAGEDVFEPDGRGGGVGDPGLRPQDPGRVVRAANSLAADIEPVDRLRQQRMRYGMASERIMENFHLRRPGLVALRPEGAIGCAGDVHAEVVPLKRAFGAVEEFADPRVSHPLWVGAGRHHHAAEFRHRAGVGEDDGRKLRVVGVCKETRRKSGRPPEMGRMRRARDGASILDDDLSAFAVKIARQALTAPTH